MSKKKSLEIISYNVNGIRAAIRKGLVEWLAENDYDIVCIQETKAHKEQVDMSAIEALGYEHYWYSAEKKGYSGVAILTKHTPKHIEYGCGIEQYDKEGRILRIDLADFDLSVMSVYMPSGSSGEERQAIKMQFLADFLPYCQTLAQAHPKLIISGDYNICNKAIDIHNPKTNAKTSGFLPEEREWMDTFFENGFIDTFRHFNPNPHHYSWWSYRANARNNNKGWRIDYQSATEALREQLADASIFPDVKQSDHCPIYVKVKL